MSYGKPKIGSTEIKKEILQEISDAIDRNSDFGSSNLAFYGYSAQYELNIILQARGPEAKVNILGASGREQQLEPGEAPPVTRKEFIDSWLANMEETGADINAETLTDFLGHVPADEPAPVSQLVKAKGKKSRGETKTAKAG